MADGRQTAVHLEDLGRDVLIKKWSKNKLLAIFEAMAGVKERVAGLIAEICERSADGKLQLKSGADLVRALLSSGVELGAFLTKALQLSLDPSEKLAAEDIDELTIDDLFELLLAVVDQNITERLRKNLLHLQGSFNEKKELFLEVVRQAGARSSTTASS